MPITNFDDVAVSGTLDSGATTPDSVSTPKLQATATAIIPTAAGLTTGIIPLGTSFATVTSANANHWVTLPDAPIGAKITLHNGATGYEIRTHDPATVGINGGTSAAGESAVAGDITVRLERVSATNWVGQSLSDAGVVSVTQVAAD